MLTTTKTAAYLLEQLSYSPENTMNVRTRSNWDNTIVPRSHSTRTTPSRYLIFNRLNFDVNCNNHNYCTPGYLLSYEPCKYNNALFSS